jgi:hypothetical protein
MTPRTLVAALTRQLNLNEPLESSTEESQNLPRTMADLPVLHEDNQQIASNLAINSSSSHNGGQHFVYHDGFLLIHKCGWRCTVLQPCTPNRSG